MSYGQEKDYIGCAGRSCRAGCDIFCADKGIDRNPSGGSRQIQDCRAFGDIDIGRNLSPSVADDIGDGFFACRGLDGSLRQFHRADGLFALAHVMLISFFGGNLISGAVGRSGARKVSLVSLVFLLFLRRR